MNKTSSYEKSPWERPIMFWVSTIIIIIIALGFFGLCQATNEEKIEFIKFSMTTGVVLIGITAVVFLIYTRNQQLREKEKREHEAFKDAWEKLLIPSSGDDKKELLRILSDHYRTNFSKDQ